MASEWEWKLEWEKQRRIEVKLVERRAKADWRIESARVLRTLWKWSE